jgi:hypothetical protein
MDETEFPCRIIQAEIRSEIESNSEESERFRLEAKYGADNVWDTSTLSRDFAVQGFMAPFCVVKRKLDGVVGTVQFQHSPRFYFGFQADVR